MDGAERPVSRGPMTNTMLTLLSRARIDAHYAAGHWRDETIFSHVAHWAAAAPERIAVRDRTTALSYAGLLAAAEAMAADFAAAGLTRGQRVAVWTRSRVETCIVIVACMRGGLVCCPSLHRDHTTGQVLELLIRMRASAFVGEIGYGADAARRDIFAELGSIDSLRRVIALAPSGGAEGDALPSPREGAAAEAGPPNAEPDLPVYLAFTSGTTGAPKGVLHSDNTLLAPARAMIADWDFDAASTIYSMSPISQS